ncbi:MAG: Hsp20/alpha crystallin family protein [Candidatus Bathyarchaeia archaeon]
MTYFDDAFHDIDAFYRKLAERMFREMEEIDKAVRSGRLQGEWDVRPIKEPGVRGYVAQGRFQLGEPQKVPKHALDKTREPLTDIFEDKEHVKLYVELPGVEKDDIQLNITDTQAEIKAKNFYKTIALPISNVELEKATANYKNGVLEVIIPKKKTVSEEKKKTIKIE